MVRIMALAATPAGSELLQPGADGGDEDKSGTALAWVLPPSIVIPLHGGQAPGQGHRTEDTMTHDKIRAAARQRMAQTGEPYTAARRAVVNGHQGASGQVRPPGAGYALRMSGEIRDWLADLRDSDPATARTVAQALVALQSEGGRLGEPLAASTAGSWAPALAEGLDRSYREQVERLTAVRRGAADADALVHDTREHASNLESGLEGMQALRRRLLDTGRTQGAERITAKLAATEQQLAHVRRLLPKVTEASQRLVTEMRELRARADAFQARKEVLKASYTAAHFSLLIQEGTADTGVGGGSEGQQQEDRDEAASAAEAMLLRDVIAQMERELGQEAWPEGLMELRPAGPDDTAVRFLFAVEPPGTALLIAVLDGPEAVRDQYLEAILLSADMLRQVRAGRAPEAAAHGYDSTRSFLAEFYPRDADDSGTTASADADAGEAGTT
jgi:phage shock protein A